MYVTMKITSSHRGTRTTLIRQTQLMRYSIFQALSARNRRSNARSDTVNRLAQDVSGPAPNVCLMIRLRRSWTSMQREFPRRIIHCNVTVLRSSFIAGEPKLPLISASFKMLSEAFYSGTIFPISPASPPQQSLRAQQIRR